MHWVQRVGEVQVLQYLGHGRQDGVDKKNMSRQVRHYCLAVQVRHYGGHSLHVSWVES